MRVKLDRDQVAVLMSGLDAIIEAAESENAATNDADIHQSNDKTIEEAEGMYKYLSEYEDRVKGVFEFSDRHRLAELFEIWAEKNKAETTPEGVIAFLQMVCLLDIEGVKEYIEKNSGKGIIRSGCHVFELVDSVLPGYTIWNIGSNMIDGYLPLCRVKAEQLFPGGSEIEPDTLKAIKCDGAQIILAAVGYGPITPEQMEKFIAKHSKTGRHSSAIKRMEEALPYMRQLKWD